jgi:hypothetical protein
MGNTSFEFNVQGKAYENKLQQQPKDWEKFNLMRNVAESDLRNHDADYERHKPQRIATEEIRLTKKYELQIKAPRPKSAPVPRMPTKDDIQKEALQGVEAGHKKSRRELFERHHTAINEHVRQALRLPQSFSTGRAGWLRDAGGPSR